MKLTRYTLRDLIHEELLGEAKKSQDDAYQQQLLKVLRETQKLLKLAKSKKTYNKIRTKLGSAEDIIISLNKF